MVIIYGVMHEMSMCASLYTLILTRTDMQQQAYGEIAEPNHSELMTDANIEKVSLWLDSLSWKGMIVVLNSLCCNMTSTVFTSTLNHLTGGKHLPYYIWDQWFGVRTEKDPLGERTIRFVGSDMIRQFNKWTEQSDVADLLPALIIEAGYYGSSCHLESAGVL